MVAERGRGEGGRGGGRRRRRRRVPALVAPTEGGGHRDPGATAADGTDGREKDEGLRRASPRPGDPGTPSAAAAAAAEGSGSGLGLRLGRGARAEKNPTTSTLRAKWQRLSHTGTARPALRMRPPPARTNPSRGSGGKRVIFSGQDGSTVTSRGTGAAFWGETEGSATAAGRLRAAPRQEPASHSPAPPPSAGTPRVTALMPHVMPSRPQPAGQGPGWSGSTQFGGGGGGKKAMGQKRGERFPLRRLRWHLCWAAPRQPQAGLPQIRPVRPRRRPVGRAKRRAARDPESCSSCSLMRRSQTQPRGFLLGTLLQGSHPEQDGEDQAY
ncbi:uncharacterized protein LOC142053228 isoform X2 [Phalacrocorax aristotelis]|uniref:uncharacterized protein LOC142053228 isoform X2 n=1 Tax=Phalacrocorax aristotelis TaxID=126867 RepID=UPI003F4B7AE6